MRTTPGSKQPALMSATITSDGSQKSQINRQSQARHRCFSWRVSAARRAGFVACISVNETYKPFHDLDEWLAISYFDGKAWHCIARHDLTAKFNFLSPEPKDSKDLPDVLRATFNLLQLANWNLPDDKRIFGSLYYEAIEQFGEYRVDGKAFPQKNR